MPQHVDASIGLGANIGSPQASLEQAVSALAGLPGASLVGVSRLYRTRPVGLLEQGDFLNAVVRLWVPAGTSPAVGAMDLLVALKELERGLGRIERQRWGPREIDLDLLLFGSHAIRTERETAARSSDPARGGRQWLEVPHPCAQERLFVLAPLADLAPHLRPPGWDATVVETRDRVRKAVAPGAVKPVGRWDASRAVWTTPVGS